MFSWVLHDKTQDRLIAARDPIGITTFYIGRSSSTPGSVYFASELKCLHPVCDQIEAFPPGHVYDSKTDKLTRYFTPKWLMEPSAVPTVPLDLTILRETFERAVRKRLMAEVPYGVLLSGGLDSSLVASIAQRETLRLQKEYARSQAFLNSGVNTPQFNGDINGQIPITDSNGVPVEDELAGIDEDYRLHSVPVLSQLNSFSIGLPGAPDSKAAAEVAVSWYKAPRIHLHHPRRSRRSLRCDLPSRDLRCHDHPRLDTHVPPLPQDQGHGREDGAQR